VSPRPDSTLASASDEALIEAIAAGDSEALRALIIRHGPVLARFARSIVGEAAAADALQESFASVFAGAKSYRREGPVKGWLFTIVRRACFKLKRRPLPEPAPEETIDALGCAAGWGEDDTPESLAEEKEARVALRRALDLLEPAEREVLLLRDVEGLSGEAAAEVLGIGLVAMKSRLHRARLRLLSAMKQSEVKP